MRKLLILTPLLLALTGAPARATMCDPPSAVDANAETLIFDGTVAAVRTDDYGSVVGFANVAYRKGSAGDPVYVYYPNGKLPVGGAIAGAEVPAPEQGERWRVSMYQGRRGFMTSNCHRRVRLGAGEHRVVPSAGGGPSATALLLAGVALAVTVAAVVRRRGSRPQTND